MKIACLETMPIDIAEFQRILEPETPEQPLIRIQKKKEMAYFEADFVLELTGVTNRRTSLEAANREGETKSDDTTRYRKSLLTGLAAEQGLEFIYNVRKDRHGNPSLTWNLVGHARGVSFEDAATSARHLFQNLNVILKAVGNDYHFAPVVMAEGLTTYDSAVIFEIDKGEWFTALTGVVITYKVGITKVLKPVEMGYANGVKYPAIKAVPGDTLYKLHYLGEGFVLFWYKGKIYSDQFPPETSPNPPSAENKIQTITRPEVGWWVKIKNKKGQIGWINVLVYFENSDSCS